jgi:hypothetical protein
MHVRVVLYKIDNQLGIQWEETRRIVEGGGSLTELVVLPRFPLHS